jgi:hypothetical protein
MFVVLSHTTADIARVIDQDVDAPSCTDRPCRAVGNLVVPSDVNHLCLGPFDTGGSCIPDQHAGPAEQEPLGDGFADARRTAGDKRRLSGQVV